jgi:hypothetical protein
LSDEGGTVSIGLSNRSTGELITATIWNTDLITSLNAIGGTYTFLIDGASLQPDLTNGCGYPTAATITTARALLAGCEFSGTADQYAQFRIPMPKAWNASTVSYRVRWATPNTGAGDVVWSLQAVAVSDGEAIDAAFGTAIFNTDTYQGTGVKTHRTAESTALTIAGSPSKSDFVYFRVGRLGSDGNDTKSDSVYLEAIELYIVTDAVNDA